LNCLTSRLWNLENLFKNKINLFFSCLISKYFSYTLLVSLSIKISHLFSKITLVLFRIHVLLLLSCIFLKITVLTKVSQIFTLFSFKELSSKMNIVKNRFSIKDLENLSGIKAHTIRIWEKRYSLLSPSRTDTNIRYYSLDNLQKLLNITLLYNNGYKISKIAKIPEKEIPTLVREVISGSVVKNHSINAFKLAMINFDQALFLNTYNSLLSERTFKDVFHEIFIPLLNELGLLWQTSFINPSHEHFIIGLIKQKILVNIEKLQAIDTVKDDRVFVLFLPESEIHEIGLLYLNYEIILKGYKSIYLGQAVPTNSLREFPKYFSKLTFLSYFTVEPNKSKIDNYIKDFYNQIDLTDNHELWVLGQQVSHLKLDTLQKGTKVFESIEKVINEI